VARILIVEDDAMIREMLVRRLKMDGHTAVVAGDGVRAVVMAHSEQPDLILMDMGLPILNGWQATQRIKARSETSRIPIIALTAYVMHEDRERAFDVGCDEFEAKPVDFIQLSAKITRLLA
jgi:CheY-like chemotaxis protein